MFPTSTINTTRGDVPILTDHECQIDWLSPQERYSAHGGVVMAILYDDPDADWQQHDIVTITAIDGFDDLPQVIVFGTNLVNFTALIPHITVELIGDYA